MDKGKTLNMDMGRTLKMDKLETLKMTEELMGEHVRVGSYRKREGHAAGRTPRGETAPMKTSLTENEGT